MATKLSTRERLEAAVKGVDDFADELDTRDTPPSAEDQENLKNRLQEITDLTQQVKAEAKVKGEMSDAKAFLKSLGGSKDEDAKETIVPTFTAEGLPMDTKGKTFGEMFVESPGYKDFLSRYAPNGTIANATKGIQSNPFQLDSKALLTGTSATSAGAAVRNDFYAPITDLVGERELTVRDLVTKGTTQSDTVEYVRVTAKTNAAATVAEAEDAEPGVITFDDPDYVVGAASGVKPQSSLALEVVSTTVKTIAHWIPITKRAASDAGQVRTMVDNFLQYGLNEELEDQILSGNGSGENFTGILSSSPQTVGSAGTDIDAVVDAIAKVRVVGRRKPTALVIHPNDWYSTGFLTAKNGVNGGYLIGDPRASVEQLNTLWGLNVVVSEGIAENTALVGDFRQAVLWEREGINVLVSDQHADFFTRNLLAVLGEWRGALGILDNQAFCTITAV